MFITRLKANINSNEQTIHPKTGKDTPLKLIKKRDWSHEKKVLFKVIQFKGKRYKNAKVHFQWDSLRKANKSYNVLKVTVYNQAGRTIFKDPMLLITNYLIKNEKIAQYVWHQYLQRSKIEAVFKFCKEQLGWENFQIRDYESIKNLISLTFFVAAYFYEIEHELTKDSTAKWICIIGNSKGKVTRNFFLKGIANLLNAYHIQKLIKEHNISEGEIKEAIDLFKGSK